MSSNDSPLLIGVELKEEVSEKSIVEGGGETSREDELDVEKLSRRSAVDICDGSFGLEDGGEEPTRCIEEVGDVRIGVDRWSKSGLSALCGDNTSVVAILSKLVGVVCWCRKSHRLSVATANVSVFQYCNREVLLQYRLDRPLLGRCVTKTSTL